MKIGKLTPSALTGSVFPNLGLRRPEVLVHAALGEDSSVIDFGDWVAVLSTDPITGAKKGQGWLGVHVACNDIAATGAEPLGVLVTLLLPESETEETVDRIMGEVNTAALEIGVEVLGGHSEVTPGIQSPIISLTAIGRARKNEYVTSAGAKVGDAIVLTKAAGLEGTAILAGDRADWLTERLGAEVVSRAQGFLREISVAREGVAAARAGATAMHDATEGGVLGAIFELAAAAGVGVEVEAERVPVRPETRAICDCFGIDPLRLVSSGCLVITCPDGQGMVDALAATGVSAAVVGRVVAGTREVVTRKGRVALAPPESDELWKALARPI